jgi:hypothetical protein
MKLIFVCWIHSERDAAIEAAPVWTPLYPPIVDIDAEEMRANSNAQLGEFDKSVGKQLNRSSVMGLDGSVIPDGVEIIDRSKFVQRAADALLVSQDSLALHQSNAAKGKKKVRTMQ